MAQNKNYSHDEVVASRRNKAADQTPEQIRAEIELQKRMDAHAHNVASHKRFLKDKS